MSYTAKRDTPRMPDAPANSCSAHGCPLRATIFDSVTLPPSNGRCRYHDAANPKDWPYLTEIFQSRHFTREQIEPALAAIGLKWQEPEPASTGEYHSDHTGITVRDYESFCRWWAAFKKNPPRTSHKDHVGTFARVGAILSIPDPIAQSEAEAEREAIQREADPL